MVNVLPSASGATSSRTKRYVENRVPQLKKTKEAGLEGDVVGERVFGHARVVGRFRVGAEVDPLVRACEHADESAEHGHGDEDDDRDELFQYRHVGRQGVKGTMTTPSGSLRVYLSTAGREAVRFSSRSRARPNRWRTH